MSTKYQVRGELKMIFYKKRALVLMFFCVLVSACDDAKVQEATHEVESFHEQYNKGNFNYIYQYMASKEFKDSTSASDYASFMERNKQILGMYKFGRLIKSEKVQVLIGYNNIRLTYHATYSNYELDELFVIRKENGKNKIQQIVYDMMNAVKIKKDE
ncbi:hypothetical protein [Lelliottia wanjuensis]|uniref:hypothetical protein n=1 Tax=Lelliottia wanjuensis TaxID=3050585 RepID=UPI00254F579B|nr:hypothetical protein [Lelliottia sp. V86_10]MDK9586917.1 hypothetical protein [Lelliottia sp. V86_10]